MKFFSKCCVAICMLMLCSCYPEHRFWWSPDGAQALVNLSDGLHVADTSGKLSPALSVPGGRRVKALEWLPDGKSFVALCEWSPQRWDQVKEVISQAEAEDVEAYQPLIIPMMQVALSKLKPEESLETMFHKIPEQNLTLFLHALKLRKETQEAKLTKEIQALPRSEELLSALSKLEGNYLVSQWIYFSIHESKLEVQKVLLSSITHAFSQHRLNSKHESLAYVSSVIGRSGTGQLHVVDLKTGDSQLIANHVTGALDWSHDGESVIFTKDLSEGSGLLQILQKVRVYGTTDDTKGKESPPEAKILATALMGPKPALEVLPDGRVIFAGLPTTLPSKGENLNLQPQLYILSADGEQLDRIPTSEDTLPADLAYFTASPDGKKLAIVESRSDAVAVLEIATGQVQVVSSLRGYQTRTMPVWKSSDELTFAAMDEAKKQAQWVLWKSSGEIQVLSKDWPNELLSAWLEILER